jgi:hypothetical protein
MISKGWKGFLVLVCVLFFMDSTAQDDCEFVAEGKVVKLLEKANNKKKYDSDARFEFFAEALDEDESCLPCMQKLGVTLFKRSKRSGGSFGPAESYLLRLVEQCPEYHSEPYFYLGAMAYGSSDYAQAELYFDKFIHFPDDDPSKFARDYDKRYDEVMETLPNVQFWAEFYDTDVVDDPKVVEGVSSGVDEFTPCLSPDGEIMFYTRKVSKQSKGDLYSTKLDQMTWSFRDDINSGFDEGEPLPPPFNQGQNCGAATISVDNKEMYVAVKNPVPDNKENMDLFVTNYELVYNENEGRDTYQWSELVALGPHINGERSWESTPSLSGDGKTLFFAAIREGCIESSPGEYSTDIFYCERTDDGGWGNPANLGPTINTPGKEMVPYMHSDSKTLYFISNGHKSRGGFDIFYSRMNDSGEWDKPKNIGHPINSEQDELGLLVSADGEIGYFVSRGRKGNRSMEVFSFKMPEKAKPDKVMILKGDVRDEDGEVVQDARVTLTYAQSKDVDEISVSADDGKYATVVNLSKGEDVLMSVEGENIAFNSRVVAKKDDENPPAVVKLEVEAAEVGVNKPFVINDIFYATNSAGIDPLSLLNPKMYVEIRGHTDDIGSEKDNLALSMDRAFEVKGHLESKGVPGNRVTAKGYGESDPVADNGTETGRAQNRRTEFVIKKW